MATAEADISKKSDTYRPGTVVTFLGRGSNRVLHAQDNHDEQESAERFTEVCAGLSCFGFKNSKLFRPFFVGKFHLPHRNIS